MVDYNGFFVFLVGVFFIGVFSGSLSQWWFERNTFWKKHLCSTPPKVGIVCDDVCRSTDGADYHFHASKDLVRRMRINGVDSVLKLVDFGTRSGDSIAIDPSEFDCASDIYSRIIWEMVGPDVVGNLSEFYLHDVVWPWQGYDLDCTLMTQVLRLIHIDEYRLMILHRHLDVFPDVVGTCGDAYVVDHLHVPFDGVLAEVVPMLPVCDALSHVVSILRYIDRLAALFPAGLHLCDFKWSHFGVDTAGRVRFIDLDAVFTSARLAVTQSATACRQHDTCHFFDCRGSCSNRTCRSQVTDNVSIFCRKLIAVRVTIAGWSLPLGVLGSALTDLDVDIIMACSNGQGSEFYEKILAMLLGKQKVICSLT